MGDLRGRKREGGAAASPTPWLRTGNFGPCRPRGCPSLNPWSVVYLGCPGGIVPSDQLASSATTRRSVVVIGSGMCSA